MANATGPGVNGQGGPGEAVQAAPGGQFLPHREVMIVLPGLLLAILLAMLDNLIVSTALPLGSRPRPVLPVRDFTGYATYRPAS